jgi:predicted DNA-binding transcriptional regulator YafY
MLILLQRHGRMTAGELAETLEVTERTVLRDVEALSEAGVPIYTTRGSGGGIALLDGFRTHLTGFTDEEAMALFLVGQPQLAHRLGLGVATRNARHKLLGALSPALARQVEQLATWFVHDPDPWTGHRVPHGELRRLARSVQQHRTVEISFAGRPTVTVEPLGLVLKAGSWWLVVTRRDGPVEALCVDDLLGLRLTRHRFTPPGDFDLGRFWSNRANPQPDG